MSEDRPRKRRVNVRPRKPQPDRVCTFRLNPLVENERRAMAVLDNYLKQQDERGYQYTIRYVMTRALLCLEGVQLPDSQWSGIDALAEIVDARMDELKGLIEGLRELGFQQVSAPKRTKKSAIPANYLANLAKAIKHEGDE